MPFASPSVDRLDRVLSDFAGWLERYGETSADHQSYFAGRIGGRAKALYYRRKALGTLAVAPMILTMRWGSRSCTKRAGRRLTCTERCTFSAP